MIKTMPTFVEETLLWNRGFEYVIGLDEVGRGSFAGPVTVGATVFKKDTFFKASDLTKINDSKLLSPKIRKKLSVQIKKHALFWSVTCMDTAVINTMGIKIATDMAFRKVLQQTQVKLKAKNIFLLIDGFHIKHVRGIGLKNQKALIKGDQKSISIASASIIAKVHRDNYMESIDKNFSVYNFAKNKGYGTLDHRIAIKKYGFSPLHRRSFSLSKYL